MSIELPNRCFNCGQKEPSWRKMTDHIHKKHNSKNRRRVHDPMELVVDFKTVDCRKCKRPILQDKTILYRHMLQGLDLIHFIVFTKIFMEKYMIMFRICQKTNKKKLNESIGSIEHIFSTEIPFSILKDKSGD